MSKTNITVMPAMDVSRYGKKRAAAYARASTIKESMEHSIENQKEYYEQTLSANPGWELVGIYSDYGISGTKADRADFQRMLNDCREGKIDLVITKSVTRFARNAEILLRSVRELKALGVDVYFEKENLHTLSARGEIVLTMMAAFAQAESESVSENQYWRIKRIHEQGKVYSCNVYGYRQIDNQLVIIPEEAEVVRRIFQEYLSGKGLIKICNILNAEHIPSKRNGLWSATTLHTMLRDEIYIGNMLLQKTFRKTVCGKSYRNHGERDMIEVENSHVPIIDKITFDRVQAEIARRAEIYCKAKDDKTTPENTASDCLKGKVFCGQCGNSYCRHTTTDAKGNKKQLWWCQGYKRAGRASCVCMKVPDQILTDKTREIIQNANTITFAEGAKNIDFDLIRRYLDHITVSGARQLTYYLTDGREIITNWDYPSRKQSWTPEMKAAARQKRLDYLNKTKEEKGAAQ